MSQIRGSDHQHPRATPAPNQPKGTARGAGRTLSQALSALLLVFVTVILVLFVVFNTQTVEVSLIFGDVQAPLVVALVIAAILGGLVAALSDAVMRRRRGLSNR